MSALVAGTLGRFLGKKGVAIYTVTMMILT